MSNEKYAMIPYQGTSINLFSDDKNDYFNLTDMAIAWKGRKSILSWIRTTQTIEYLNVWEKKYNPKYDGAQMSTVLGLIKSRSLSIKNWIDLTHAIGIFTKVGQYAGTYAHKDIAIKFAAWLSPEFELFLIEKLQELKELERKKNSFELLDDEQVLYLMKLKEVFKYVVNQEAAEAAHKDFFASQSDAKNPFAEFNVWRSEVLDITEAVINKRIEQYCIDKGIPLSKKLINKTKREKIFMLDSYDSVRIAVWDALNVDGNINADNLAKLVKEIIKMENGEVYQVNETNLFRQKQVGFVEEYPKYLSAHPNVTKARQILAEKKEQEKKLSGSTFNKTLKGLMKVPPPLDEIDKEFDGNN